MVNSLKKWINRKNNASDGVGVFEFISQDCGCRSTHDKKRLVLYIVVSLSDSLLCRLMSTEAIFLTFFF